MTTDERRMRVLELLEKSRFSQNSEVAKALGVSVSTIRRDVEFWMRRGAVRKTYGGATFVQRENLANTENDGDNDPDGFLFAIDDPLMSAFHLPGTPPRDRRVSRDFLESIRWSQKLAIAEHAAAMVPDGDTVLIDGGSTAYLVAQRLVSKRLTLVTNSLPVANLFVADPTTELILIGGSVCPRTGVARGPYADSMLQQIRVKRAIISAAGIDADGFYNDNLLLVETQRTIHRIADEVVVVADSSKFGHKSFAHVCGLDQVTHIVTDDGIQDDWKTRIIDTNVRLHIVKTVSR